MQLALKIKNSHCSEKRNNHCGKGEIFMQKIVSLFSLLLGLLIACDGQAQSRGYNNYGYGSSGQGYNNYGYGTGAQANQPWSYSDAGASADQYSGEFCCGTPQDTACGECYCLYCHYEPYYYNTYHCVSEPRMCKEKCCRYVPRYYEKPCVKYVPQYYSERCCKYVPEYYYRDKCTYVNKTVCETKCQYVPKYYYKHVCASDSCN